MFTQTAILLLLLAFTNGQNNFCPKNSVSDSSGTKCFRFFPKSRTYNDAKEFCTEIDGKIADLSNATDIWERLKGLTGQKECFVWSANQNSSSCNLIVSWKFKQEADNCTILAPFVCELSPTCQSGGPVIQPIGPSKPATRPRKVTPSKPKTSTSKPKVVTEQTTVPTTVTGYVHTDPPPRSAKPSPTTSSPPKSENTTKTPPVTPGNKTPSNSSGTSKAPIVSPISKADNCPTPPKTQKQCVTTVKRTPTWLTFNNSQYLYFSKEKKNWEDAEAYCKSQGGNLASIHSQCEFNYIISNICDYLVWIGGVVRNEVPAWVDGSKWNWSKFANSSSVRPEYGIYIYWKNYKDSDSRIMRYGTKSIKASFVCKKPSK